MRVMRMENINGEIESSVTFQMNEVISKVTVSDSTHPHILKKLDSFGISGRLIHVNKSIKKVIIYKDGVPYYLKECGSCGKLAYYKKNRNVCYTKGCHKGVLAVK
jgi:hypothetical protein